MVVPDALTVNIPLAYVPLPATPTEPTSPSDQPEGSGVMVKAELFAVWPLTVTENGPEDAPDGTSATILVSLHATTVALIPLSNTVLAPCVAPKLCPVIVTGIPTGPEVGVILVIVGDCARAWPP